jgi:hypothetical protein
MQEALRPSLRAMTREDPPPLPAERQGPPRVPSASDRVAGEPLAAGQRRRQPRAPSSEAAACAMQTYWSATGRTRTIELLLARTPDPVEHQALQELKAVEEQRATVARDALAEIWGFELSRPPGASHVPKEAIPWTQQHRPDHRIPN